MKKMKMLLIALFAFYNLGGQLSWGLTPPVPVPLLNCDKRVDIDIASQKSEGEGIGIDLGIDYCQRHNIIVNELPGMYIDWESCEKDRESYRASLYRCINECKPPRPWIFRKQAEAEKKKLTAGLFKSLFKSKFQIWKAKTYPLESGGDRDRIISGKIQIWEAKAYPQLYSRVISDLIGMKSIWETCNQVRNIYWGLLHKCWDQCGGAKPEPPFVTKPEPPFVVKPVKPEPPPIVPPKPVPPRGQR